MHDDAIPEVNTLVSLGYNYWMDDLRLTKSLLCWIE